MLLQEKIRRCEDILEAAGRPRRRYARWAEVEELASVIADKLLVSLLYARGREASSDFGGLVSDLIEGPYAALLILRDAFKAAKMTKVSRALDAWASKHTPIRPEEELTDKELRRSEKALSRAQTRAANIRDAIRFGRREKLYEVEDLRVDLLELTLMLADVLPLLGYHTGGRTLAQLVHTIQL